MIEGLAGGRWAVLSKVHHCLVDGVGGAQLYGAIFGGPAVSTEDLPRSEPAPSTVRLVAAAVGRLVTNPAEQVRLVAGVLRAPVRVARQVTATLGGLAALAGAVVPASPSSLSGPIGRSRRYRVARGSLPDIVEVGRAFGVTVNDVILAAISASFRTLLLKRGEDPAPDTVLTLVPVSVRANGQAVTMLARHEPFAPLSWGIRLAARLPHRNVVTVTTNVPGPRLPLQVLGREIIEILPYVPIALRLRIGVAVLSYQDRMTIGITGDYDSTSDIDVLAAAIEQGIADLVAACH